MDIYGISASALTAQRLRLDAIASNLANVNATRRPDGQPGPYRRKNVVFGTLVDTSNAPQDNDPGAVSIGPDGKPFLKVGVSKLAGMGAGVQVVEIYEDTKNPSRRVFDPSHPDADPQGYVELPNINPVTEMVDMIAATRAYEANVTSLNSAKQMRQAALEI